MFRVNAMSNPDNQQICPICNLKKDYKLIDANMLQDLVVNEYNKPFRVKVCIECWLKDAHTTAKNKATKNEVRSNDYRNKYFSSNSSFNSYFNY